MNKESIDTRQTISSITAGLVVGLIFVVVSISLSTLVFSGELREYLSRGIGLFLFSGLILSVVLVSFGKFHGVTIAPQDGPAALLAVAAGGISGALVESQNTEAAFYTVAAGIILCSLFTGAAFFLIGQFNLGNMVRYIPYPVVGGFLAGTGWLLTSGAIEVMTGQSLGMETLSLLFQSGMLIRWLPGAIFAIIVLFIVRRSNHFLIWPGIVASALLIFYTSLYLTGTSIEQARSDGLLLQPFPSGGLWTPFTFSNIYQVDWNVLASQL
ncbi:MAG TPA: sodium-independent anion transporter, partial [Anaerolineae bacterium]|nr:sodium-independent anion transporter [Anaerolineae bacterium]